MLYLYQLDSPSKKNKKILQCQVHNFYARKNGHFSKIQVSSWHLSEDIAHTLWTNHHTRIFWPHCGDLTSHLEIVHMYFLYICLYVHMYLCICINHFLQIILEIEKRTHIYIHIDRSPTDIFHPPLIKVAQLCRGSTPHKLALELHRDARPGPQKKWEQHSWVRN